MAIVLVSVSVFAQGNTGRITGTVTDPTGAVVGNAKVTAVNVKTQKAREASANEQGNYVIAAVDPGIYTLTATAAGFSKTVISNLAVEVSGTAEANFKMTVGSSNETVEVAANAVAVQTTESSKSAVITMKDIDTLPALNRTPITLAVFQPGVQVNPGDVSFSRINGQRQGSNNATLDGIDVNDSVVPRLGLSLTANNSDSVGEFRIITQGAKAEYGRNAGGQVEMITRSGTNSYHGNAFDYLRNTDLNANDFFNKNTATPIDRPKFIQNIFGGSFGGPIKKNRLFIFGNYQGRRTRQEVIRNRTVLTNAAKAGIFTYKDSTGAIKTYDIAANDPRGIGVDPQVKKIFAMLPASNNCDVGDGLNTCGYRFNNPSNSYEDQFTIKGDANITDKIKVFLRWSWQRNSSIDSLNSADATYPGQVPGTQGGHRWGYSTGGDWTISNTIVNEFRYGHQSAQVAFVRDARLAGPTWVSNLYTDPISSSYAQGRNSPVNDVIDNVTKIWGNHVFKMGMKYSHTSQYGYNLSGVWYNLTDALANGNVPTVPAALSSLASGTKTTYQQLYNDVLGRMDSIAHTFYSNDLATFQAPGVPRVRTHVLQEHGYYFQDDWKVTRNLSLNLGVRWELFLPPVETSGAQATIQNAAQITPTNTATNLTIQQSTKWYNTDWNNFAPRIGFAYDVMGDGKTAIRGNYGLFYDRNAGATVSLTDSNTPGFSQGGLTTPQSLTAAQLTAAGCNAPVGDVRFNDCIPLPATPASPALTPAVSNRSTSIVIFNPNLRTGYVHSFGLNVQREITHNTIVEAGYVGNLGVKLFMDRDFDQMHIDGDFLNAFKEIQANQISGTPVSANNTLVKIFGSVASAVSSLGASNFTNGNVGAAANTLDRTYNSKYAAAGLPQTYLRSYPQFNQMIVGDNSGRSYYHALQLSVRRNTGALRMAANYTYSHSIDNISVDGNGFTTVIDNYNLALNRASGDADHRHSGNASVSYTLPFGQGKRWGSGWNRVVDSLLGGWEVGQVWIIQDGTLFTVNSQRTTRHLTGTGTTNASTTFADYSGTRAGTAVQNSDGTVSWFNTTQIAGFTFPVAGAYGNSGRNGFRGPGYFDVDASLVKRFKVTESQSFTFRAEAYNLFNKTNFTNPGVNLNNIATGTFGRITSTTGPAGTGARNLQLTLRYDF